MIALLIYFNCSRNYKIIPSNQLNKQLIERIVVLTNGLISSQKRHLSCFRGEEPELDLFVIDTQFISFAWAISLSEVR